METMTSDQHFAAVQPVDDEELERSAAMNRQLFLSVLFLIVCTVANVMLERAGHTLPW